MKIVKNTDRKFGADLEYYHLRDAGVDYLFTEEDLISAKRRAENNKDDFKSSAFSDMQFWVISFSILAFCYYLLTKTC